MDSYLYDDDYDLEENTLDAMPLSVSIVESNDEYSEPATYTSAVSVAAATTTGTSTSVGAEKWMKSIILVEHVCAGQGLRRAHKRRRQSHRKKAISTADALEDSIESEWKWWVHIDPDETWTWTLTISTTTNKTSGHIAFTTG